ncbi:MAG: hypothetical protein ACTHOG_03490 [Marmoricola sp.]
MASDDIYAMLGLPPDTRPAGLREAYERAVADAARSHNIRRATQLSAAFDRLPDAVRESVYATRGTAWVSQRPRRRRARAQRASRSLNWVPVLAAVGLVTLLALHR